MTPARLRWGLTFILVGVVLLLVNMGRIYPPNGMVHILPWILIGIGLEKIFTSTRLEFLSYLAVVGTAVMVGYTLFEGVPEFLDKGEIAHSANIVPMDQNVQFVDASIVMSEAQLDIRATSADLFRAEKPSGWGTSSFSHSLTSDKLVVDLDADRKGGVRVDFESPSWEVALAEGRQTSLVFDLREVDAHLNLATVQVSKLDIQASDCELYIKLGELQQDAKVDVYGESNKVKLRLPSSSGVRIRGFDDDSYFESLGMRRTGGAYLSDNFDASINKIDIVLDESLNSLNIDFY